jgi:hypothetical protein
MSPRGGEMTYKGYARYVDDTVGRVPRMDPILSKEIAARVARHFDIPVEDARVVTNNHLRRLANHGNIDRVQKGLYCHVEPTVFGKASPDVDVLTSHVLMYERKHVIGYETGASLLNRLGLMTLMPRKTEIATNSYTMKLPKGSLVVKRKPVVLVNNENWRYLQFIDAVHDLQRLAPAHNENNPILKTYAEKHKLDFGRLITIAKEHYSRKLVSTLACLLW